jgi:hypothetical protein
MLATRARGQQEGTQKLIRSTFTCMGVCLSVTFVGSCVAAVTHSGRVLWLGMLLGRWASTATRVEQVGCGYG